MFSPPQVRAFSTVVPATSLYVCPHVPPGMPAVKSRKVPPVAGIVDVVVLPAVVVEVVVPPDPHSDG
jgi:hypothetical protein